MSVRDEAAPPWTVWQLGSGDFDRAIEFLRADPLVNIYMLSRLLDGDLSSVRSRYFGIRNGDVITSIALLSPNITIAPAPDLPPLLLKKSMELLADTILTRMVPVRAIIAPVAPAALLWEHLQDRLDPPTVTRLHQPVYVLDTEDLDLPGLDFVRLAKRSDLTRLVPACAAMHLEEVEINPLERDAAGYRRRIEELVRRRRSYVAFHGRRIAFKCEVSAVTDEAVQLMGVWTAPALRRKGFGKKGLREVCGHISQTRRYVTLFVNDFNHGAIRLYEEIGFRQIGVNRALIW